MKTMLRYLLLLGLCLDAASSRAAGLTVAAAADLKFALDELVTEFQTNQTAIKVKVTYGSSGNFYAQIQNQAPFDLYFLVKGS